MHLSQAAALVVVVVTGPEVGFKLLANEFPFAREVSCLQSLLFLLLTLWLPFAPFCLSFWFFFFVPMLHARTVSKSLLICCTSGLPTFYYILCVFVDPPNHNAYCFSSTLHLDATHQNKKKKHLQLELEIGQPMKNCQNIINKSGRFDGLSTAVDLLITDCTNK